MITYKIPDKNTYENYYVTECKLVGADDRADIEVTMVREANILSARCKSDKNFCANKFLMKFRYDYCEDDKIYVNGYQSWTDSFEYGITDKMYAPAPLMKAFLAGPLGRATGISNAGDLPILKFKNAPGKFYGFSYSYVRRGNAIDLIGSLSERTGYTVIEFDVKQNEITVWKDLEGKEFSAGESALADLGFFSGEYGDAFDAYFNAMNIAPFNRKLLTGYTTWYNYYNNIDSEIVSRDLQAIGRLPQKVDIFQIDDGYQRAVGDWLNTDKAKFAEGMKPVAQSIHAKGMLAGIWLAPFAVTKKSFIYKEHRDWLVRNRKGKLVKAGANWGGFYSLDIYNPEARLYVEKVFDTVLSDWGYDLVKLDFLYCACIEPIHGKSRGEIMCDAMDLLRKCCKDKLILGCGVPLAPAFGKVDYCRIGPDISLEWGKKKYDSREGVSVVHAMLNSVFRRHLDGRAFGNDPDVFLLRDNNIRLSREQKKTLAECNKLTGKVLFTSDNVDEYDEEKKKIISKVFDGNVPTILGAEFDDNILRIEYRQKDDIDVFIADMKY